MVASAREKTVDTTRSVRVAIAIAKLQMKRRREERKVTENKDEQLWPPDVDAHRSGG